MQKTSNALPSFPVEIWSTIASYATSPSSECDGGASPVSALRCTSRAVHLLLSSESYYRARVADIIRTYGGTTKGYPNAQTIGGHRNLFKVIVQCIPLEGWYTIEDAWPWWAVVRVSFADGRLCGDLVSAPHVDDAATDHTALERILEVSFCPSALQCSLAGKTAESVGIKWKGDTSTEDQVFQSLLNTRATICRDYPFPNHGGVMLEISDILKGPVSDTPPPGQVLIPANEYGARTTFPPPSASVLIELFLEREATFENFKNEFRLSQRSGHLENYYRNELRLEYLYGLKEKPLISGQEIGQEKMAVGHNLKMF